MAFVTPKIVNKQCPDTQDSFWTVAKDAFCIQMLPTARCACISSSIQGNICLNLAFSTIIYRLISLHIKSLCASTDALLLHSNATHQHLQQQTFTPTLTQNLVWWLFEGLGIICEYKSEYKTPVSLHKALRAKSLSLLPKHRATTVH